MIWGLIFIVEKLLGIIWTEEPPWIFLIVMVDYFKTFLKSSDWLSCFLGAWLFLWRETWRLGTSVAKWKYYEKVLLFSPKGTSLSRELPENSASSILEKLMWCSFQNCLVYSSLWIFFDCARPGSFLEKSSNPSSLVELERHSRDCHIWAWLCINHAGQAYSIF